ncbi:TolC family protein [bacterium]|jgi:outer membrane protein TolC|nr:TolC family protein [bacterium]
MRYLFLTILLTAGALFVSDVFPDDNAAENMADLITEALDNNPAVQESYNLWKAAEYKIRTVKSLPDPVAQYQYFGESVETRVGPQKNKYGVSQKIPFPGKLGLKGRAQSKQAEIFKERYEAAKREVIKNVKFVYYDIFWVDKAVQITEEEKAILESLEKVAQKRYESDFTPQQDVIKAQVKLSKLIDNLLRLNQNRKSLVAKLNTVLNRPRGAELGKVTNVDYSEFQYDLQSLHEIAGDSRQELIAANMDIERAEYERSLAKMDYLPDFNFGFDYIQVGDGYTMSPDDGQDAWMVSVAVNIPLWFDKLNAQVNEKKAQLEAARKNYENMENDVSFEVDDLYFKILTYKDIISLYKTALIPQSEQAFDAAKAGYETGKVDFLNWLDAERILLQTRLAYYKAITDYRKSIAFLERVIGNDL